MQISSRARASKRHRAPVKTAYPALSQRQRDGLAVIGMTTASLAVIAASTLTLVPIG